MTQILNGKILSKFCSYLVCCNFDQNILVVKKHWQSMMSSRKFFGKSTKYRTTWTYCSLFFDNLKCLCLNLFILNYFCMSLWGKCADSIFFHLKISLTESVTKVILSTVTLLLPLMYILPKLLENVSKNVHSSILH